MRRVLAVVEGFTERTVVEQVIAPYLGARHLSIHPKVLGKPGHKGGIRSFDAVAKEILALMRQEATSVVTTFLDFYGLPASWPGLQEAPGKKAIETATSVEKAMALALQEKSPQDIGDLTRVIPYVQMHEIEALLFADVKAMAAVFERPNLELHFQKILQQCGECEEINDNANTAPSKRIETAFPGYRKGAGVRAHAPLILRRIGVDRLRQACPHFDDWITRLERAAWVKG